MTGLSSNFLQSPSLLTNNNAFLGLALHINHRVDMDAFRRFLKLVYHHFHRIRDFLIEIQEDFFADDFRYKKARRLVRHWSLSK